MSEYDDLVRQIEQEQLLRLQFAIADFVDAERRGGPDAAEQRKQRGRDWLMAWANLQSCAREIEHEEQNALGCRGKHDWCCELKGLPWAERQRKERE